MLRRLSPGGNCFPLLPQRAQPVPVERIWICRWVGHGLAACGMYCSPGDTLTSTYTLWGIQLFLDDIGGQRTVEKLLITLFQKDIKIPLLLFLAKKNMFSPLS